MQRFIATLHRFPVPGMLGGNQKWNELHSWTIYGPFFVEQTHHDRYTKEGINVEHRNYITPPSIKLHGNHHYIYDSVFTRVLPAMNLTEWHKHCNFVLNIRLTWIRSISSGTVVLLPHIFSFFALFSITSQIDANSLQIFSLNSPPPRLKTFGKLSARRDLPAAQIFIVNSSTAWRRIEKMEIKSFKCQRLHRSYRIATVFGCLP